jgi:hypothetical protein
MAIFHPLEARSPGGRRVLLWWSSGVSIIVGLILLINSYRLKSPAAPLGMGSFELAGNSFVATSVLASWDKEGQVIAAFNVGLDFLFVTACSLALSVGCLEVGRRSPNLFVASVDKTMSWCMFILVLVAFSENLLLFHILKTGSLQWIAGVRLCAELKYSLIISALCSILFTWRFASPAFAGPKTISTIPSSRTRIDKVGDASGSAN